MIGVPGVLLLLSAPQPKLFFKSQRNKSKFELFCYLNNCISPDLSFTEQHKYILRQLLIIIDPVIFTM